MSDRSTARGWGPSAPADRRESKRAQRKLLLWGVIALALLGIANGATRGESSATVACGMIGLLVMAWSALPRSVQRWSVSHLRSRPAGSRPVIDPRHAVRQAARGGVYLGVDGEGNWRYARSERAVLLLGPPRSGKTTGVIIPALIAHPGPVVSASTKPDVARATRRARSRESGSGCSILPAPALWRRRRCCAGHRCNRRGRGMRRC